MAAIAGASHICRPSSPLPVPLCRWCQTKLSRMDTTCTSHFFLRSRAFRPDHDQHVHEGEPRFRNRIRFQVRSRRWFAVLLGSTNDCPILRLLSHPIGRGLPYLRVRSNPVELVSSRYAIRGGAGSRGVRYLMSRCPIHRIEMLQVFAIFFVVCFVAPSRILPTPDSPFT